MKRTSPARSAFAAFALAFAALSPSSARAQAQDLTDRPAHPKNDFSIDFDNTTKTCAWITISGRGNLGNMEQVKGDGTLRKNTGPMYIAAGAKFTFWVASASDYRIRAEVAEKNCTSGYEGGARGGKTIYDTDMAIPDARRVSGTGIALKQGKGNYYLEKVSR